MKQLQHTEEAIDAVVRDVAVANQASLAAENKVKGEREANETAQQPTTQLVSQLVAMVFENEGRDGMKALGKRLKSREDIPGKSSALKVAVSNAWRILAGGKDGQFRPLRGRTVPAGDGVEEFVIPCAKELATAWARADFTVSPTLALKQARHESRKQDGKATFESALGKAGEVLGTGAVFGIIETRYNVKIERNVRPANGHQEDGHN